MKSTNAYEFYATSQTGEVALIEIFKIDGFVGFVIGGRRYDLQKDSAFEIADTLIMMAHDVGEQNND